MTAISASCPRGDVEEPDWLCQPYPGGRSWDACQADDCGVRDDGHGCSLTRPHPESDPAGGDLPMSMTTITTTITKGWHLSVADASLPSAAAGWDRVWFAGQMLYYDRDRVRPVRILGAPPIDIADIDLEHVLAGDDGSSLWVHHS